MAAREAGAAVVIASFAFDRMADEDDARTMMGVSPEQAAEFAAANGCDVVGLNCGTGIDIGLAADLVRRLHVTSGLPTLAKPNAGAPVVEDLRAVYRQAPAAMAADLPVLLAAGPRIVGACCGSTPEHIRHLRKVLDGRDWG
jgi:5-methyltetrahydrofolate--homocysteine methyltransferase